MLIEEVLTAQKEMEVMEDEVVEVSEITIRVSQLFDQLQGLLNEAHVQRVVVKNQDGRVLFELPLYLGVFGIVLLKSWTALGLIVGLLAEVTISVERRRPQQQTAVTEVPQTADDLQAVTGIGPKVHRVLHAAGISSFAQLATMHPDQLRTLLTAAGSNYDHINPTSWPQQAAQLHHQG